MKAFFKILSKVSYKYFAVRKVVYAEYTDETMTVVWDDETRDKYEGSGGVWYKHPYMERCEIQVENMLCGFWKYNKKWKGAYPKAHIENCDQREDKISCRC